MYVTSLSSLLSILYSTMATGWRMLYRVRRAFLPWALLLIGCIYIIVTVLGLSGFEYKTMTVNARSLQVTRQTTMKPQPTKHVARIQHITNSCEQSALKEQLQQYRNKYTYVNDFAYYFYPRSNTVYCKVPKVGCTFLVELFATLEMNPTDADMRLFETARKQLHTLHEKQPKTDIGHAYPTVIAARDPYSRLYSAYVDKVLLPNMYRVPFAIQNSIPIRNASQYLRLRDMSATSRHYQCANHVTFQQFLDSVVTTAKSTERMNQHWAPVSSICPPCQTHNHMIIKQETFNEDIEDLLKSLNVTKSLKTNITDVLIDKRIELTLPGIVQSVFRNIEDVKINCITNLEALQKIWESFQIQGYIAEDRQMPRELHSNAISMSPDTVGAIMVREAQDSNLTTEESAAQRNAYLVRAYANISTDTIAEIKEIYHFDFLLFDYSMTPPV